MTNTSYVKWPTSDEIDTAVGTEMFGCFTDSHEHSFMPSVNAMVGKEPNYQGSTKLPEGFTLPDVAE